MRGPGTAIVVMVVAGALGAHGESPPPCHGFSDPRGDARSPAIDIVEVSFALDDARLSARVTMADLSAPPSAGADQADAVVDWGSRIGRFRLVAIRDGDTWTFQGTLGPDAIDVEGAPVPGTDTIEMSIDAALVEEQLLHDVIVGTGETFPAALGFRLSADGTGFNDVAPGVSCPSDPSADGDPCTVIVDDEADSGGTARAVRDLGGVDPRTGDDVELRRVTVVTHAGSLAIRVEVADLRAPRWPASSAAEYQLGWRIDGRLHSVRAVHDDAGWTFSGHRADDSPTGRPLPVSGTVSPDDGAIRFEIPLDALPLALDGRPLQNWAAAAGDVPAPAERPVHGATFPAPDQRGLWGDFAPDDFDAGWFAAGGGCVADALD